MPKHVNERIARLREIATQGLYATNAERALRECDGLMQDGAPLLLFFCLRCVFAQICEALESGPVQYRHYQDLTAKIGEKVCPLLDKVRSGDAVEPAEIEDV